MVTGAGGGIGSASVERFVAEGATVVAADLFEQGVRDLAGRLGARVVPTAIDIADEDSFRSVIDATMEQFGRLDVLFNNAALTDRDIQHRDTTAAEVPLEVWNRTLAVNLTGYLIGCRHAIPRMLAQGSGSIINMASNGALAGDSVRTAYCTSKAAVVALTKNIATQYGKKGIRCNAILPGPVITETFRKVAPELEPMLKRHALTPELGVPEDIAGLAAYLAADESRYMTGQALSMDGGLSAHHPHYADFEDYLAGLAPAADT